MSKQAALRVAYGYLIWLCLSVKDPVRKGLITRNWMVETMRKIHCGDSAETALCDSGVSTTSLRMTYHE